MNCNGTRIALMIVTAVGSLASPAFSQQPKSEWEVEKKDEVKCSTCPGGKSFHFTARRQSDSRTSEFNLSSHVSNVRKLHAFGNKAVILGEARASIGAVAVHDLATNSFTDEFFGFDFSISPSGRYLAFRRFYPRGTPADLVSDVVSVYDLGAAPDDNRLPPGRGRAGTEDVGLPVFPIENVKRKTPRPLTALHHYLVHDGLVWTPGADILNFVVERASMKDLERKDYATASVSLVTVDLTQGSGKIRGYIRHILASEFSAPGARKERFSLRKLSIDPGKAAHLETGGEKIKEKITVPSDRPHDEAY